MNFACNLPLFCMVLCLLCAVISSILRAASARRLTLCLATAVMAMNLYLLIFLLQTGQNAVYQMGHYPHPWGNEIRIGVLGALFSAAFALILGLCVVGGRTQLLRDLDEKKTNLYYATLDLVLISLQALSYTNDLFTGYVFIEIGTIAACGILMIRQIGRTTLAAVRYMIFSLIGSGLFMLGLILLYAVTGHLLMPNLREAVETLWDSGSYRLPLLTALCLLVIGLGIKSGLFPFHFWMPDTYGYATPASAGVLSGLISKGYILLLLKIVYDVFGMRVFYASGVQNLLYGFGIMGMIVGSVSAMREDDLFRMIADSSAAQIGYIYMGIGISAELGILAALFHILTHAFTKPALFLAAAQLSDAVKGGRDLKTIRGAAHGNRVAGAAFTLGALSMIGLPMTMGFISKASMAVREQHWKRRLVYSTVANLSYILFGVTMMTEAGFSAALLHMAFHASVKILAFFCAGAVLCRTGRELVPQLDGLGRSMPHSFAAFTVSALALTGIPPLNGFVSKWQLLTAAADSENPLAYVGAGVLLIAALLTAIYMLGPVRRAWFPSNETDLSALATIRDADWRMTVPYVILMLGILLTGLFASPILNAAQQIAQGR